MPDRLEPAGRRVTGECRGRPGTDSQCDRLQPFRLNLGISLSDHLVVTMAARSDGPTIDRFLDFLSRTAPSAAADALQTARDSGAQRTARDARVRASIATRWAAGWEYFDAVVFAMEQNALIMMDRANKTDDEHSAVREALLLIQSAATATTHEIRILLQAGLWAGAAGRWRALHELAVTGTLLSVCDASIAERYVDHSFVVNTKRLRDFYLAHGTGPASREVLDERWMRAQAMISRHHDARDSVRFTAQYAWATPLLPAGKSGRKPRPTFDALEALAKMADLRSLVGTAHGLVHNDGAGIIASVIEEDGYILTPSDRHIETVARPTLLSIRRMVGATHLGFEGELNEFAEMIGLLGATLMHNAILGARAFGLQETEDSSPGPAL